MAFVSVQDITQPTISPIVGIFSNSQNAPYPDGYIGQVDDNDSRIAIFIAEQNARYSI